MAIEVKRKEKETTGSLLRRFTRLIQQSGILFLVRKARFYEKPKTKREKRESALRRDQLRKIREKLIKSGQLQEGEMIPPEKIRKFLNQEQR